MKIINFEQFLECPSGTIFFCCENDYPPDEISLKVKWQTSYIENPKNTKHKLEYSSWVESDLIDYDWEAMGVDNCVDAHYYIEKHQQAPISSEETQRDAAYNYNDDFLDTKFGILEYEDIKYLYRFLQKLILQHIKTL